MKTLLRAPTVFERDLFTMVDSSASLGGPRPRQRVFLVATSFLLLLIICDVVPGTQACSMPAGWRPPSDIERVIEASVVIYGQVLAVYPDRQYPGLDVYTANVEVYCVMKGARTEQFVNITEAGA